MSGINLYITAFNIYIYVTYFYFQETGYMYIGICFKSEQKVFALCKSDRVLRARIRDQIYQNRIAHIMPVNVEILCAIQNVHRPFSSMNGLQQKIVTITGEFI